MVTNFFVSYVLRYVRPDIMWSQKSKVPIMGPVLILHPVEIATFNNNVNNTDYTIIGVLLTDMAFCTTLQL